MSSLDVHPRAWAPGMPVLEWEVREAAWGEPARKLGGLRFLPWRPCPTWLRPGPLTPPGNRLEGRKTAVGWPGLSPERDEPELALLVQPGGAQSLCPSSLALLCL